LIWLISGEVEMDESYFGGKRKGSRGRGAKNKIPVFGILRVFQNSIKFTFPCHPDEKVRSVYFSNYKRR
jgi:hypothetical protein